MMPTRKVALTVRQRATLNAVGDELIPRSDTMPSASDVDVGGELIDLVLRSRDDLADQLATLLDELSDAPPRDALAELGCRTPERLGLIRFIVAGAYLMDQRVCDLIGYSGQEPRQVDPYDYVALVESGLLDPVVARGPIYRPSPQSTEHICDVD